MALVRRGSSLQDLDQDDMTTVERVQEQESTRILRLLAQAVGSFGFAASVLAICVVWFMPALKPEQPNYHRRATPLRSRRDSLPTDIQSIVIPRRSLSALIATAPPSQTAFSPPRHVRRVTFDVILSKPSRSHLGTHQPPPRITLVSQGPADAVESGNNRICLERDHSPDELSPSSSVGSSSSSFSSAPRSTTICSGSSSGASSTTTLENAPADISTLRLDIGCSKHVDRGTESDASSRRRSVLPLHRRLPNVKQAFKRGGSKPPSSYTFPTQPLLSRTLTDTTTSDSEQSISPQRRSTLSFWPRCRKFSQPGPGTQSPECNESATPLSCGNFVRRLSLQRNDKSMSPTPNPKQQRRRSTPVARTQPYGYPHFAPTPIPLSDIPDPELTRQTRHESNKSPVDKTSQQVALGVGRMRPPGLRDATL